MLQENISLGGFFEMSVRDCSQVLEPLQVVAWGEVAMAHLGVKAVTNVKSLVDLISPTR
jgi:hypothetical protein